MVASVVLPVPGGPQKIIEPVSSRSICRGAALSWRNQMLLADDSSSVRGRMRSASGRVPSPELSPLGMVWSRLMFASLISNLPRGLVHQGNSAIQKYYSVSAGPLRDNTNTGQDAGVSAIRHSMSAGWLRFSVICVSKSARPRASTSFNLASGPGPAWLGRVWCCSLRDEESMERRPSSRIGLRFLGSFVWTMGSRNTDPGRGADHFGVEIGWDCAFSEHPASAAKGFRRAEDRAQIPRVLYSRNCQQWTGLRSGQDFFKLECFAAYQGRDALRSLAGDCAGETTCRAATGFRCGRRVARAGVRRGSRRMRGRTRL